ncbi:hypothetical protein [Legionella sp. km772]|uniref:hypothetical protein n=1 Tax=Legionella sp. km772 TaxID=2498111 RepID=UPI000F8EE4F0|nr:hypothetical protein [Legionella sp. km772]RUR08910.1 hypothetical protein ELY15_09910 [Legionella sp. km772]
MKQLLVAVFLSTLSLTTFAGGCTSPACMSATESVITSCKSQPNTCKAVVEAACISFPSYCTEIKEQAAVYLEGK